jgi:hypothetical protein
MASRLNLDPIERARREAEIPSALEGVVPAELRALILDQRDRQSDVVTCLSAILDRIALILRTSALTDRQRIAACAATIERATDALVAHFAAV